MSDDAYVWLECSVVLSGDWMPTMEWTQHGEMGERVVDHSVKYTVKSLTTAISRVISTLVLAIDTIDCPYFYSCKTDFTRYNGRSKDLLPALTLPNFSYTWSSPNICTTHTRNIYTSPESVILQNWLVELSE